LKGFPVRGGGLCIDSRDFNRQANFWILLNPYSLDELERGILKTVLEEWATEPLTLYAIYPKHRQHAGKL
jgi:hypothetical protein